jgi:hypothetical protein
MGRRDVVGLDDAYVGGGGGGGTVADGIGFAHDVSKVTSDA